MKCNKCGSKWIYEQEQQMKQKIKEKGKLRATCTWGDGPDVLLVNEGNWYMLYDDPLFKHRAVHGYSFNGSFCLSIKEAKELIVSLQMAVMNAEELENSAHEYFENKENEK